MKKNGLARVGVVEFRFRTITYNISAHENWKITMPDHFGDSQIMADHLKLLYLPIFFTNNTNNKSLR